MSIRSGRLSTKLSDVLQLDSLEASGFDLGGLVETVDKTLAFSDQRNLVKATTKTLAEGMSELLDTSDLGEVGEIVLGKYASKTESNLLNVLNSSSGDLLKKIDSMAKVITDRVINKVDGASVFLDGYKNVDAIWSRAAAAFLSIESLLQTKSVEEVLGLMVDISDDPWYLDLVKFSGFSLLDKRDFKSLNQLFSVTTNADYEYMAEDLYKAILGQLTSTPKDIGEVSAMSSILSKLNNKESALFVRTLDNFRPTKDKIGRLFSSLQATNHITEIVDETDVSFRAVDVLQVKLMS